MAPTKTTSNPKKHPRCIHMPAPPNTVIIYSSKRGKIYEAGFTIGNQDFTLAERSTKEEAQWFCDVLTTAFEKLIEPPEYSKLLSPENKKMVKDNQLVKIKNLR